MEAIKIQAWNPKRAKRRVSLPLVALVNAVLILTSVASSAFVYQRLNAAGGAQTSVAETRPEPATAVVPPAVVAPRVDVVPPAAIVKEPEPVPPAIEELIEQPEMPKPARQEVATAPPVDTPQPKAEPEVIVMVDVANGKQVVDLTDGGHVEIDRAEGFPGRPAIAPMPGDRANQAVIQPFGDRTIYLLATISGSRLMIEAKSILPQFSGQRLSADRASEAVDQATIALTAAVNQKAAIMAEIARIDGFLKDGVAKTLTVYGRGESQKQILRSQIAIVDMAIERANREIEQARRVHQVIIEQFPKIRLILRERA